MREQFMYKRTKMTRNAVVAAILLLGLTFYAQANAQSLFRCGKTYQDRPCDAGQETKILTSRAPSSPGIAGSADAMCNQRGAAAQRIVWAREAGAILDQQLAKTRSRDEQNLIIDVYNRRGTSAEIRTAIEADCIAEKEKAARLAALLGTSAPPAKATDDAEPVRQKDAHNQNPPKSASHDQMARDAERKKVRCNGLQAQLENVKARQRTGGSMATMDMLNSDKSRIEKQLIQDAC